MTLHVVSKQIAIIINVMQLLAIDTYDYVDIKSCPRIGEFNKSTWSDLLAAIPTHPCMGIAGLTIDRCIRGSYSIYTWLYMQTACLCLFNGMKNAHCTCVRIYRSQIPEGQSPYNPYMEGSRRGLQLIGVLEPL